MSVEPRFEVGADYDGVDPRHHQVNEVRQFSNDKTDRIFMPECGAFYTDTMIIKDVNTGKVLARGQDYDLIILDSKATNESGMEVCGVVVITNNDIAGVMLDYFYVGGIHATGYYLLEQLLKMYPNGAGGIISYDDLMQIPEEHDPAYHTQHVHEFFGTDSLLVWLERLRCAIVARYEANLKKLYDHAQQSMDSMYAELDENYTRLIEEIELTFEKISVQSDEYILTDSNVNPATTRGYGTWQLVTDSVLHGASGSTIMIGSGGAISTGNSQIIRNCYIWKNIANSTLTESTAVVTSDVDMVNEGDSITFTITTTGIASGTRLNWAISNADAADFSSSIAGIVTITNGVGTVKITTKKDYVTDGDKNHVFYLTAFAKARKAFLVRDSSQTSKILGVAFIDNGGNTIDRVSEDQSFRLAITSDSMVGSTAFLQWTLGGGLEASSIEGTLPTGVTITGPITYVGVKTVGNLKEDQQRYLSVRVFDTAGEPAHAQSKIATVDILDTSQRFEGTLSFLDENDSLISTLDEGDSFKIRLKTNGGVGRTVNFVYTTNKEDYEFTGLVASGVVQTGNIINIDALHNADYVTRIEPEFLNVKAYDGTTLLAEGTLMFNDTSKTPNFQVMYSKTSDGSSPVTTVNEGETFYIILQVPDWVGANTPPVLDLEYKFTGSPNKASRLTTPSKMTPLNFDGKNDIADVLWVNNNTLAIKHTAIADKAKYGDATYSFRWKTSRSSTWSNWLDLAIVDTSIPTLTATWSSSNATLTPITSVNEMTVLGARSIIYLWITIDSNAASYRNLRLQFGEGGTTTQADLVTVFPQTLAIANGVTKHIVTVEINNDFLTEGNEKLQLKAMADGVTDPIFVSEITIVDNSVQTALTAAASTATASAISPADGKFSEWDPAYLIFTHPAFEFDTDIVLTHTFINTLNAIPTSVVALANTTRTIVTLTTSNGRKTDGDHSITVTGRRQFDGKWMSAAVSATFNYKNDKTTPEINNLRITSDPAGNNTVTSVSEGGTYYIHASVNKPFSSTASVFAVLNTSTSAANGVGKDKVTFTDNYKVIHKTASAGNYSYNLSSMFTIPVDRVTNTDVTKLSMGFKIDWNTAAVVGGSYPRSIDEEGSTMMYKLATVNFVDSSKTISIADPVYTGSSASDVRNAFDEGEEINVRITLTNATIGDVYSLSLATTSGVKADRFSYHEFDSKDITITSTTQTLVFRHVIDNNMKTDGVTTGLVKLNNKTAGTNKQFTNAFTVNDTSKTLVHSSRFTAEDGTTTITSVNEGATFYYVVEAENLPAGTTITATRSSGRPLTDFTSHELNVAKTGTVSGAVTTFKFKMVMKSNAKTGTDNTLTLAYTSASLTGSKAITINDTSQTRSIGAGIWRDTNASGAIVTSVNEGSTVVLVVTAGGGTDTLNFKLTNNGGRDSAKLLISDYDVTKTRTSDTTQMVWRFRPYLDQTTNTGADLQIKVRVTCVEDATVYRDFVIPINDTSKTPFASAVIASSADSTTQLTSTNEGTVVYANLTTQNMDPGTAMNWSISDNVGVSVSGGITINHFDKTSGSVVLDDNGKASVAINVLNDEYTSEKTFRVVFNNGQVSAVTSDVKINDTSKSPAITDVYWSTNQEGTDSITTVNGGETIYLIIKTLNILKTGIADRLSLSFPNSEVNNGDLIEGAVQGTQLLDVGTYTALTGVGHTWYKLKFVENAPAIPATPNNTYHFQSDLPEFVLAANTTKTLTMVSGVKMGASSDWDPAPSGLTGIYTLAAGSTAPVINIWGGGYGTSGRVTGVDLIATTFDWANYDRNWGSTSDTTADIYGYIKWGGDFVAGNGLPNLTSGGVTMKVISDTIVDNSGRRSTKITLTNNTAEPKVFKTMFGQAATYDQQGGVGEGHGVNGGTLAGGTWIGRFENRTWSQTSDGYIVVSDS